MIIISVYKFLIITYDAEIIIDDREEAPDALTIKYWQFGESNSNPLRPGHNKIESEYKYMNGMSQYVFFIYDFNRVSFEQNSFKSLHI